MPKKIESKIKNTTVIDTLENYGESRLLDSKYGRDYRTYSFQKASDGAVWVDKKQKKTDPSLTSGDSSVDENREQLKYNGLVQYGYSKGKPVRLAFPENTNADILAIGQNTLERRSAYEFFKSTLKEHPETGSTFSSYLDGLVVTHEDTLFSVYDGRNQTSGLSVNCLPFEPISQSSGLSVKNTKVGHNWYGGTYELPLMSPFTSKFGGESAQDEKLTLLITESANRPEAYSLIIDDANQQIFLMHPRHINTASYDDARPVGFYRDGHKKTVHVGNLLNQNFKKNYELVSFAHTRFHKRAALSSTSSLPFGLFEGDESYRNFDQTLPDMTSGSSQSSLISRFSAPGGEEVESFRYLDKALTEYSVYNSLNYRNTYVRNALNVSESRPSDFNYYDSVLESPNLNFHKVHANRRRVPNPADTSSYVFKYDNKFVNHQIPFNDIGYSWIRSGWIAYLPTGSNVLSGSDGATILATDNLLLAHPRYTEEYYRSVTASSEGINTVGTVDVLDEESTLVNITRQADGSVLIKQDTLDDSRFDLNTNLLNREGAHEAPMWRIIDIHEKPHKRLNKKYQLFDVQNNEVFSSNELAVGMNQKPSLVFIDSGSRYFEISHGNETSGFAANVYYSSSAGLTGLENSNKKFGYQVSMDKKDLLQLEKYGVEPSAIKYHIPVFPKNDNVGRKIIRSREYDGSDYYGFLWKDSQSQRNTPAYIFTGSFDNLSPSPRYANSIWPTDYYALDGVSGSLMQTPINRTGTGPLSPSYVFNTETGILPDNRVQTESGRGPFSDSYAAWSQNLRIYNKGYSIVPEFKISSYVDYAIENRKSFFEKDLHDLYKLELKNENIDATSSLNPQTKFLELFAHSEDLGDYDEVVEKFGDPDYIELELDSLIKFLPEDDLYVQNYSRKLATKFLEKYVDGDTSILQGTAGTNLKAQVLLDNYFAPGIFFNTVKAGVAVSYPAIVAAGTVKTSGSFPFESIIEPSHFIGSISGSINEIDGKAKIYDTFGNDATASLVPSPTDRSFDYMSSQYHAGVVGFFIDKISSVISKDEVFDFSSQGELSSSSGIKKFMMDVVLEKNGVINTSNIAYYGQSPYYNYAPPYFSIGNLASGAYYDTADPFDNPVSAYNLGKGIARVTFDPSYIASSNPEKFASARFTAEDILSNISVEYINYNLADNSINPAQDFTKFMPLRDSINILSKTRTGRLAVATKFECPVLDFTSVTPYRSGSVDTNADQQLWSQYGSLPTGDKGLWLKIEETRDVYGATRATIDTGTTGSLAKALNFNILKDDVGKLPENKNLEEAIVAVPFYINECGEEEYYYHDESTAAREATLFSDGKLDTDAADSFIRRQVKLMSKYNMIPSYDWVSCYKNKRDFKDTLGPVVFYIFENSMKVSASDLSDIWQGVAPSKTNEQPLFYKSRIKHRISDVFSSGLKKGTRWKLFKIKKKAPSNYFKEYERQTQLVLKDKGSLPDLEYNYNYPYDHFSITEGVKLGVSFDFETDN